MTGPAPTVEKAEPAFVQMIRAALPERTAVEQHAPGDAVELATFHGAKGHGQFLRRGLSQYLI